MNINKQVNVNKQVKLMENAVTGERKQTKKGGWQRKSQLLTISRDKCNKSKFMTVVGKQKRLIITSNLCFVHHKGGDDRYHGKIISLAHAYVSYSSLFR